MVLHKIIEQAHSLVLLVSEGFLVACMFVSVQLLKDRSKGCVAQTLLSCTRGVYFLGEKF